MTFARIINTQQQTEQNELMSAMFVISAPLATILN
jgi:hypothetical protein